MRIVATFEAFVHQFVWAVFLFLSATLLAVEVLTVLLGLVADVEVRFALAAGVRVRLALLTALPVVQFRLHTSGDPASVGGQLPIEVARTLKGMDHRFAPMIAVLEKLLGGGAGSKILRHHPKFRQPVAVRPYWWVLHSTNQ